MIQISQAGVRVADAAGLADLRQTFARQQCICLPQFLAPDLLQMAMAKLATAEFRTRIDATAAGREFARELCVDNKAMVVGMLQFLLNAPRLFRAVEHIADCGHIGNASGRIYRMLPDPGHYDSWHSDTKDHRLVGISINLSDRPFAGGAFQLRDRASARVLCDINNTGPGDALLFRIAPHLQHQVAPVTGDAAKTAFAGWFRGQPEYATLFRQMVAGS